MRILIINTYHYLRGGDSQHALKLAALLEKEGHEIHFFAMRSENNLPCMDEEYFVSEIDYREALKKTLMNSFRVVRRSIYSMESRNKIAKLLDTIKPDIAHLHSFLPHISVSILPELKKRKIPVVWTLHDYKKLCPNSLFYNGKTICEDCRDKNYVHVVLKRCKKGSIAASIMAYLEAKITDCIRYDRYIDKYLAPSTFLRNKFIEYGHEPSKVIGLPNFIETDTITPQYNHRKYLLFIGRLEREKGLSTLLRAFAEAAGSVEGLRLKIAGMGSMEHELKNLIARMDLPGVTLIGFKQGTELQDTIQNAKAIVVPSECYENYPYSCLEAMAYGKPIIGSKIGGIPEQIQDNLTGFLFEPFDYKDLAKKIKLVHVLSDNSVSEIG